MWMWLGRRLAAEQASQPRSEARWPAGHVIVRIVVLEIHPILALPQCSRENDLLTFINDSPLISVCGLNAIHSEHSRQAGKRVSPAVHPFAYCRFFEAMNDQRRCRTVGKGGATGSKSGARTCVGCRETKQDGWAEGLNFPQLAGLFDLIARRDNCVETRRFGPESNFKQNRHLWRSDCSRC
jgi:hypothetical protein